MPHITEDIVDGMHRVPHERVPKPRKKLIFLYWPRRPASQPNTGKVKCTGKVFTVKVRHHRGDQACAVDTVGLNIKGLNKYNIPQSGDVMVPVPQIQELVGKSRWSFVKFLRCWSWSGSRNERTIAILRTSRGSSRAGASGRFFGALTAHSFYSVPVEAVGYFANSSSMGVDIHTV